MRLTKKFLLYIVSTCAVFFLVYYFLYGQVIVLRLREQKVLKSQKIMSNALTVVQNETGRIRKLSEEWAAGDIVYRFADNPGHQVRSPAGKGILEGAEIDFMAVVNRRREIVNLWSPNSPLGEVLPDGFKQKKSPLWDYLLQTFNVNFPTSGTVTTKPGPMIVVTSPIVNDADPSLHGGRLLVARLVDKTVERKIRRAIHEDSRLLVKPVEKKSTRTLHGQIMERDLWVEEDNGLMTIDYAVYDVWGDHAYTIRIVAKEKIFAIVSTAIRIFFILLFCGFILLAIISYLIFDRLVVKRVANISEITSNIISFNDLSLRIPAPYNDEVTLLTRDINMMLERLQEENLKREEVERMLVMNEKLVYLGKMAADIAHEINNPLFAISNSFQLVRKYLPTDKKRVNEAAQLLENEIKRVKSITRNLHRFTIQGLEESTQSNLVTIMDSAVKVLKWSKKLGDVEIVLGEHDNHYPLYCNPGSLQQVFMNLIVNSVDAMRGKGSIIIEITDEGTGYRIDYKDTGPGIGDDVRDQVFLPFKSGKPGEGSGLGLHISHNIIVNHGGSIALGDDKSNGAHFVINIPKERRSSQQ